MVHIDQMITFSALFGSSPESHRQQGVVKGCIRRAQALAARAVLGETHPTDSQAAILDLKVTDISKICCILAWSQSQPQRGTPHSQCIQFADGDSLQW